MSENYCDCNYKGNVLTDLEKMELIMFITGEVLQRLVGKDYLNLKDHLLSVPDLAVKFADALEKRNSIRETSTFTTQSTDADGNVTTQVSVVNDVWFDRDVKDTKSTTDYTQTSDDIRSLGNVNGSGDVEDLAIAMSKDSVLVAKVETLINAIETIKVNFNDERMVA